MGGDNAPLTVQQSVSEMLDTLSYVRRTKKSNGLYMHGSETPYVQYATPPVLKEILDAMQSFIP